MLDFWTPPTLPEVPPHSWRVSKTRTRRVVTLALGPFLARETIWRHPTTGQPYPSAALRRLVAPSCNYGYDVVVAVGRALFLETQPVRTVITQLAAQHVHLSARTVGELGRRFVVLLTLAHRRCLPQLKEALALQGGYILHLDATYEDDSPLLMTGIDAVLEIVLGNIKLPSEKAEEIVPFLRQLKESLGPPRATVHDLSKGILAAIHEVFPDTPDFVCHFHFLRDLGKDLFGAEYEILRKTFHRHGTMSRLRARLRAWKPRLAPHLDLVPVLTQAEASPAALPKRRLQTVPLLAAYTLAHWILAGLDQGHGYGFPFDRPLAELAHRSQQVYVQLAPFQNLRLRSQWRDNLPWHQLQQDLQKLQEDRPFWRTLAQLETKAQVFDQLRQAFHLAPATTDAGLNHDGENLPMETIKAQVLAWRARLLARPADALTPAFTAMIQQLDHYHAKLFAQPLRVVTPEGTRVIQPQRTNNLMERFFRHVKRDFRRRTGQNALGRTLRTMLTQTPLVKNLQNESYLKILLRDHASLEELFAEIDPADVRQETRQATQNPERIPAKLKRFIAKLASPAPIKNLLEKLKFKKSNRILPT